MIDWSLEWMDYKESTPWMRELRRMGITSEEYWDGCRFADRDEEYNELAGYPGRILDRMMKFAGPDSSVLDIGAGAGAYTIPLAKAARKVTAVEPSRGQVARLLRRADREGLENIEIINKRWQDVDCSDLARYDLVNAAYCFQMTDIGDALQRMVDATSGALFLVSLADHGFADVYENVFGEKAAEPEFIYLYNALVQMGCLANVEIMARSYQIPFEMQLEILSSSRTITPELNEKLMAHLASTGRLVERRNGTWVKRTYKDGMIWYSKY